MAVVAAAVRKGQKRTGAYTKGNPQSAEAPVILLLTVANRLPLVKRNAAYKIRRRARRQAQAESQEFIALSCGNPMPTRELQTP